MRKFLIGLLFFAFTLSEIDPSSSAPLVKVIDIVGVSFGNNLNNAASIELVASNLTEKICLTGILSLANLRSVVN